LVELQQQTGVAVETLSDLRFNKKERQRVCEAFFLDPDKTGGEAYEINVMMVKIQLEKGTMGSREFL
jgi:hypothetical protein